MSFPKQSAIYAKPSLLSFNYKSHLHSYDYFLQYNFFINFHSCSFRYFAFWAMTNLQVYTSFMITMSTKEMNRRKFQWKTTTNTSCLFETECMLLIGIQILFCPFHFLLKILSLKDILYKMIQF